MAVAAKLLLIFVDEGDRWKDLPLYEALVRKLQQLGCGGATVTAGIMGFGKNQDVHQKGLFGVSDERPVTVQVCETAEKIAAVMPAVKTMVEEGLVIVVDCERYV